MISSTNLAPNLPTMCKAEAVSSYERWGDSYHAISIVSTTVFAALVVLWGGQSEANFFDSDWKYNGFCITNKTVPYWNSHDVCLYVDVILAGVLGLLYLAWRKTPGMDFANGYIPTNIIGIIAHGFGHGQVGRVMRENNFDVQATMATGNMGMLERALESGWPTVIFQEAGSMFFWIGLLYASMKDSSHTLICLVAVLARIGQVYMPTHLAFTYVQTVLMIAFSLNQRNLSKETKNSLAYASYPLIVGLPTTLIGWMESTQCTNFVEDYFYGHVVYDGYIALSLIGWYTYQYVQAKSSNNKVKAL